MKNLPPLPFVDGALLLDNSTIELLRCPRLLEYKWLRRRTATANRAGMNFGSTLHQGWAVRYQKCGNKAVTPDDIPAINAAMEAWLKENPQPDTDFRNYNHAVTVMSAYNETYKNEPFDIINDTRGMPLVERTFWVPLGTVQNFPVIYTGKIDLGIRNHNGVWSQDHKTTFQFGDSFDSAMQMDGGQHGYLFSLWKITGELPAGYIIDAVRVRKPKKTGRFDEVAPVDGTDFIRTPYIIGPDALEEWREDTLNLVSDMMWHYDRGYFPRHRWQCVGKFGRCEMFEVCASPRKDREDVLANSGLYMENDWTPLKQPEKPENAEKT